MKMKQNLSNMFLLIHIIAYNNELLIPAFSQSFQFQIFYLKTKKCVTLQLLNVISGMPARKSENLRIRWIGLKISYMEDSIGCRHIPFLLLWDRNKMRYRKLFCELF